MVLAENLYRTGSISIGKVAKHTEQSRAEQSRAEQSKAKQSKAEFSEYLSKLGIPVIDYPTKELDNKLDYFKS